MAEQQKAPEAKKDTAKGANRQKITAEDCKRMGLDPSVYGLKAK